MAAPGITDLDELTLLCRGQRARDYIAESVACYRAGAFRAAIVTTWIAVVLDILDKLHELDLDGNKKARAKLEEFEQARKTGETSGNWQKSNQLERGILDTAKDSFELLAAAEYEELTRLRDDRNRCAHPSFLTASEPYQPSAELARYHIRNAVMYLLSHPPVQGQEAFDRIMQDFESSYFPQAPSKAQELLSAGPLARARKPLVRNLVLALLRTLLLESATLDARQRRLAALSAVLSMHRSVAEATIREDLPKTVERVADEHWCRVIWFLRELPATWDILTAPLQHKARQFVADAPRASVASIIGDAVHIPALVQEARMRIDEISVGDLSDLLESDPAPELSEGVLRRFAAADSFSEAYNLGRTLLIPSAPLLTTEQVREALRAYVENPQIHGSGGMFRILLTFLEQTESHTDAVISEWKAVYEIINTRSLNGNMRAQLVNKLSTDVLHLHASESASASEPVS